METEFQKVKDAVGLIKDLYDFCQQKIGFDQKANISFVHNAKNAEDPLGRTAYYDPDEMRVTLFITGRHIKDIMRSLAHELVHHLQQCRGDLQAHPRVEGYAQTDDHLREMEREAYEVGNMVFRDWEDQKKSQFQKGEQ